MATFLPGVTDTPVQQHLYQPDYNFLASVMGQKQQQYDQGFAKVKNIYSSLLNSPLSNQENVQYRDDVFRKLETQLRSVASADLSQSSNVAKAKGLFKPLLEDGDLQTDMALTHKLGTELSKADMYMNSSDPEQRAKYSDLSRRDLLNVRQQLSESKRGDGSMKKVQSQEFTPFEDVKGYLDKQAKDQGFKVVHDTSRGFYLVKTTNGPGSVPLFDSWAKQAMGTRFDRQFQVESRVGMESGLRRIMAQSPGISRDQAQQSLAQTYAQTAIEDIDHRLSKTGTDLDAVNTAIGHYKNKSSIPESDRAHYLQLISQRDDMQQQIKNYQQNRTDYQNPEKIGILATTLPSVLTEQLKARSASQWAQTHALLTEETEIRPDQAALTQFTVQHEDGRFYSKLKQDAQFKSIDVGLANREFGLKAAKTQFDMGMDKARFEQGQTEFAQQQQVRESQLAVNEYAAGVKGYSAMNGKATGANGKPIPGVAVTGSYTTGQNTAAVDVLHNERQAMFQDMYKNTFDNKNSPVAVFYPEGSARQDIISVASTLMDIREGRGGNFTPTQRKTFEEFTKRFHVGATLSQNPIHAHELLQVMSAAMARALPNHMAAGVKAGDYDLSTAKSVIGSIGSLVSGQKQEAKLRQELDSVSSLMRDKQGHLLPQYEGATPIGVNARGQTMYDASTVKDQAAKLALNKAASQQTMNQTRLSGTSYQVNLPEEGLLSSIAKSNQIMSVRESNGGEFVDITSDYAAGKDSQARRLMNLPASALQAALGKTIEARVDPARNSTTFVMKIDPKAGYSTPKTGLLGQQGTVEIEVNNDKLRQLQPGTRISEIIDSNTPKWGSLGKIHDLSSGKTKNGKAPDVLRGLGFDYDFFEQNTGNGSRQMTVRFSMQNPIEGGAKIPDQFVSIPGTTSDRDVALRLDKLLTEASEKYIDWSHQVAKQHKAGQPQVPMFTLPQ